MASKKTDVTQTTGSLVKSEDHFQEQQECCGYCWRSFKLAQSPLYPDDEHLSAIEALLQNVQPVVTQVEVEQLSQRMSDVALQNGFVIQVGDCAETFRHSDVGYTTLRISLFSELHHIVSQYCSGPIITLGRMAGQFAKPRSCPNEIVNDITVSSYFGDVVNNYSLDERTPDPDRLMIGYQVAFDTVFTCRLFSHVWSLLEKKDFIFGENFFVCHEAYLMPYEQNLLRQSDSAEDADNIIVRGYTRETMLRQTGKTPLQDQTSKSSVMNSFDAAKIPEKTSTLTYESKKSALINEHSVYSTSGHFLWVGDRTRQPSYAHVQFAKHIINPIGVKVGPTATGADIVTLVNELNPDKIPGHLALIFRLGIQYIDKLREYATALKETNQSNDVLWFCDPMHGNTLRLDSGFKTRRITDIKKEIQMFFKILNEFDIKASGIHLEITPHEILECLDENNAEEDLNNETYLTACDPRLNSEQAVNIIEFVGQLIEKYSKKTYKTNVSKYIYHS